MKCNLKNLSFALLSCFVMIFSGCKMPTQPTPNVAEVPPGDKAGPSTIAGIVVDAMGKPTGQKDLVVQATDASGTTFNGVWDANNNYKIVMNSYQPPYSISSRDGNGNIFTCMPDKVSDAGNITEHLMFASGLSASQIELAFMSAKAPASAVPDHTVFVRITEDTKVIEPAEATSGIFTFAPLKPGSAYIIQCVGPDLKTVLKDSKGNLMLRSFTAPAAGSPATIMGWTFLM